MLRLEDIYVVSSQRSLVSESALTELESALGGTLPPGYRRLLETLGLGAFCSVVEVKSPAEVLEGRTAFEENRALAPEHRFWKNWNDLFMPGDETKLVSLATSLAGDEICMHTEDAGVLAVLPRNRDLVVPAESFEAALHYFAPKRAWFEPRRATATHTLTYDPKRVDDILELLGEEMAADFDDGDDPPGAFFFARPGAMVEAHTAGRLFLRMDEAHARFVSEIGSCVADRLTRGPGAD